MTPPGDTDAAQIREPAERPARTVPTVVAPTWIDRLVHRGSSVSPVLTALAIATLLVAAWAATLAGGGSSSALPHLFYIPIILATVPFGGRGALAAALAATVLCGPLMPLDTSTGESQPVLGWALRGLMFVAIGALGVAGLAVRERHYALKLSQEVHDAIARSTGTSVPVDLSIVSRVEEVTNRQQFHMVYQPVYSLRTSELLAVEALARFDSEPYRPPNLWFGAAEYAGLGVELELAAIEKAITGASGLPDAVALSVNASPRTVADPRLAELLRSGNGRPVTIEITEHALIDDYRALDGHLQRLRDLGVKVAVDDAGAGFASLRHIVLLAPDVIKLDITLTQDLVSSPLRRALGGSLIEFALHSDATLIVEGIEEREDLHVWSLLGAHACQGYLLGRPGSLPFPEVSPEIKALPMSRAEEALQGRV